MKKLNEVVLFALAGVMLVSMLASCNPQSQGEGGKSEEITITLEDVLAGEVSTAPVYDTLVIDNEKIQNLNPRTCGLEVFYNFNFDNPAGDSAVTESFKNDYLDANQNSNQYAFENDELIRSLVYGDIVYRPSRANVKFDIQLRQYNGWKHELVLTENDFVLVSQSPKYEKFLTGFVDGVFKNEAGFVEDSAIENLKNSAKGKSYQDILVDAKSAFFSQAFELEVARYVLTRYNANNTGTNGKQNTIDKMILYVDEIYILDESKDLAATCRATVDIQHDYIKAEQKDETVEETQTAQE